MPPRDEPHHLLNWSVSVPLLTNRFMFLDFLRWMGLTCLAMALIACLIGLFAGDAGVFLGVLQLFGAVCAGMTVLFVLVMFLFFGNRLELAFRLDERGAHALVASRRGRAANRAAVLLGALAGKPGVAGAGLLAQAQEHTFVDYSLVRRARFSPRQRVISLGTHWLRTVRLYCTPRSYPEAERLVRQGLASHARRARIVDDPA
ncbi:hypothetical protein NNJEOMEG_03774 [Fundidesulfovibrio magnetotacticus]|uniref:Uncharacterized protein n=1 Tax=Fundidesulfovibrio magnetotacticus TaxID=2730080 RepID=A0A6V8LZC4_9BACT|nr:hypothetical protein [Fundidesulfovibrio magnetotacticus]GFK95901.1 hypothetical protein NNJEOMEG_03774 [Fundidesulfovibrio magnetotacticus]